MKNKLFKRLKNSFIVVKIFLFVLNAQVAYSQLWEAGIMMGASNYLGDIGGGTGIGKPFIYDLQYSLTRPALGIFVRNQFAYGSSIKANIYYGEIEATDALTGNYARHMRNLHFKSDIYEVSVVYEKQLLKIKRLSWNSFNKSIFSKKSNEVSIYTFGGLGVFYVNPKAKIGSKWYELQPLGTEGQGIVAGKKTYSRTQLSIPAGISIIYKSNSRVRIGFEIGYRKTFTDYLDDVSTIYFDENILVEQKGTVAGAVSNRTREITTDPDQLVYFQAGSQRGDPTDKDSYIFSVFSINYLLNYETCPTFNSKSLFRKYRGFKIGY